MAENAWSALHPVRAALCRAEGNWLWYNRTDPYTGAMAAESYLPSPYACPANNRGVFIHPMYTQNPLVNDIALVKLEAPFSLSPYTQTVALPAPAGYGDHFGIGHPSSSVCQLRCYTVYSAGGSAC